jgi:OPT oligopeptide transporter protein
MGCVVAPLTFNMFYTAFPVGKEGSAYAAPYATVYRAMAILGTQGFGALPGHCLQLFVAWFCIAIAMALARFALPAVGFVQTYTSKVLWLFGMLFCGDLVSFLSKGPSSTVGIASYWHSVVMSVWSLRTTLPTNQQTILPPLFQPTF